MGGNKGVHMRKGNVFERHERDEAVLFSPPCRPSA